MDATQQNSEKKSRVHGIVRDEYQRSLAGATVEVYTVGVRNQDLLGKATTDNQGAYEVEYRVAGPAASSSLAPREKSAPDIVVKVLDKSGALLSTSPAYFNAAPDLEVNIDLSGRLWKGSSELTVIIAAVTPFLRDLPLAQVTEDKDHQDVSFLVSKTGIVRPQIEALAMAARFESQTKIALAVWYALVRVGPVARPIGQQAATDALGELPSRAAQIFGTLMRENIDSLMTAIQGAIDHNTVAYAVTADLPALRRALLDAQQRYLKSHPTASQSPELKYEAEHRRPAGRSSCELRQAVQLQRHHAAAILDDAFAGPRVSEGKDGFPSIGVLARAPHR